MFFVRTVLLTVFAAWAALLCAGHAGAEPAPDTQTETATVAGRLVNSGEPVAGATVRALDTAGTAAGSGESGEDGRWKFDVPVGSYTFEVVQDSLPEGVSVQGTVNREITAGRTNTVVFTFGEVRTSIETPLYERIIRLTIDGLRFGLVIAVAAIGLSLIF